MPSDRVVITLVHSRNLHRIPPLPPFNRVFLNLEKLTSYKRGSRWSPSHCQVDPLPNTPFGSSGEIYLIRKRWRSPKGNTLRGRGHTGKVVPLGDLHLFLMRKISPLLPPIHQTPLHLTPTDPPPPLLGNYPKDGGNKMY